MVSLSVLLLVTVALDRKWRVSCSNNNEKKHYGSRSPPAVGIVNKMVPQHSLVNNTQYNPQYNHAPTSRRPVVEKPNVACTVTKSTQGKVKVNMPGNLVLVSSRTPTEDDCNELVEALTEYETACQKIIADEEICTRVHKAFNDGIKKGNFMMTETTKLGHIITYYYKTCIVISIDKGPTFTITEEQRLLFETPEGQRIAISHDQLLEMETSSGFLLQMKLIKSLTSENVYKLPLIPKTLFEDIRSDSRSIKGTDLEGASPSGRKSHGETAMRHV